MLNRVNLEREKKYLLLYLDKTAIRLLSFQMQSAKELIAVSKKLAASDFCLIPTDLGDSVSIHFTELDVLMYNGVKRIIIRLIKSRIQKKRFYKKGSFRFKNSNKKTTRKQHSNINAAAQPLFSETSLHQTIEHIVDELCEISDTDKSKPLHTSLLRPEEFKEILRGLTCGAFMRKLLTVTNTKRVVDQLLCEVKGLYGKYRKFQNSPDGIQDVILHSTTQISHFYKEMLQSALLDANLIDPENKFIYIDGQEICHGAMQKPLKMIQIANALLPPIVWTEGTSRQVELIDYNNQKEDLLPPNSFYVQAYSIFTVQEVSVKLESTFDSVCDTMWNHLMALGFLTDIDQHGHCDTHLTGEYSTADYHFFKCSMTRMAEELLHGNFAKRNQDIDISYAISISKECNCSFQVTFRALINIGLQPVIIHIATIIASSLASSSFFGLYTVSALIIMDDSKERLVKDHHDVFKKAIQSCLKAHYRRTIIFYNREAVVACQSLGSWCSGLQQVFGKGTYSQVSSTDYILRFSSFGTDDNEEGFAMYKYHSDSLKQGEFIEKPHEFVILEKGHALDPRGSIHVFYMKPHNFCFFQLDLFTINRHKDKVSYHWVWRQYFNDANLVHPFAVRVTPQHHSSTIEFEVSYLGDYKTGRLHHESFSILERLSLK
ncbi:hypothetical protein MAM1_0107c05451 [Mucor ambiguus]|uniref:Uncharacterized protein n=1 Tax=Mucor ambiguus TaxID=91626 RepID=A0A0C9LV13_9FUNG|nr:hypothetical protein MAM1_0107c05451 [Mucor ambiguus]